MKPSASIPTSRAELEALALATHQLLDSQLRGRPLTALEALSYRYLQQLQKRALSRLGAHAGKARLAARKGKRVQLTITLPLPELLVVLHVLPATDYFLQLLRGKVHQALQQYSPYIDIDFLS